MRTLTTEITQSITDPIVDPATVRVPVVPRTGLVGWFRSGEGLFTDTAMNTPASAEGDTIAAWYDQSGSANHLKQAAPGSRPALNLNQRNGYSAVNFASKTMALAAGVTMNLCTIFVVARDTAGSSIWISNGADTNSYLYTSNLVRFKAGAGTQDDTATFTQGTWHLACGLTNGTTATAYVNGRAGTGQANTDDFVWNTIGLYNGAALISGRIAEILVYNVALSVNERRIIEGYLNGKYLLY